jgi:hypothetical protein
VNFYNTVNMNSNTVTGLPAPTNASDAATKSYVDSKAAPVTSVNNNTGAVVLSAGDIAITDTNNVFNTDTVQGAINQLFQSANDGKTNIASAIGSPATSSDTFSQLAGHVTTGKGQIATAINDGVVTSSSTFTQLRDAILNQPVKVGVNKTFRLDENVVKNDVIESYYRAISATRIEPVAFPGGTQQGYGVAFSADGQYLALSLSASPFIIVYRITGSVGSEVYTACTLSGTLPTGYTNIGSFSPNGEFLSLAGTQGTNLFIMRRISPTEFTVTGQTITGTIIENVTGLSWSANSQYLAVAHRNTPFFGIYQRSGSTFTRLTNTGLTQTVNTESVCFSPDGNQIVYGMQNLTNNLVLLVWNGTTYAPVSNAFDFNPGGLIQINTISYSADGNYLAAGSTVGQFIYIYTRSGNSFTRIAHVNINVPPAGNVFGVTWTSDNQYLIVTHVRATGNNNTFSIYRRRGTGASTTFTRVTNPTFMPASNGWRCAVSPDNRYIAIGHAASPSMTLYRNDGELLFVKGNTSSRINNLDMSFGVAKTNGTTENTINAGIIVGGELLP